MTINIFRKIFGFTIAPMISLGLLLSCGGSSNDAQPGDYIPIGSTISLIMGNGTNVTPYLLAIDVVGNNYGQMHWQSKESASGYAGFTFIRSGNKAEFNTSFRYAEGTFITYPGPVFITPFVTATVQASLNLPDTIDSMSFRKQMAGTCSYTVSIEGSTLANEPLGTYTGTGSYGIEPTALY